MSKQCISCNFLPSTQAHTQNTSWDPTMGRSPCQYFQLHSSPAEESFCSVFSIYWLILANQNAKEKKNAIAAVYLDSL